VLNKTDVEQISTMRIRLVFRNLSLHGDHVTLEYFFPEMKPFLSSERIASAKYLAKSQFWLCFVGLKSVSLTLSAASHSGDQHTKQANFFASQKGNKGELSTKKVYSFGSYGTHLPDFD